MSRVIMYFSNDTDTMVAGKALRDAGVWNKIVAKPKAANTDAHMALEIELTAEMKAMTILSSKSVVIGGTVSMAAK